MRRLIFVRILLFTMMVASAAEVETQGTETLVQERIEDTNAYISNILQKYDVNKYFKMSYKECEDTFGFTKEEDEDHNVFVYFDAADPANRITIVFEEDTVTFICYRKN